MKLERLPTTSNFQLVQLICAQCSFTQRRCAIAAHFAPHGLSGDNKFSAQAQVSKHVQSSIDLPNLAAAQKGYRKCHWMFSGKETWQIDKST